MSNSGELKAIFFDIDDTLYSTSEFAKQARLNSVHAMIRAGLRVSVSQCFRELQEVVEEFGSNYDKHYDKLLLRLPPESWESTNKSIIIASAVVAYHQTKFEKLKPYDDVVEVFQILDRSNLILGIISAGLGIKQAEKLVRLELDQFIYDKAIFVTEELGINKPNPKLYKKACKKLLLNPMHCMYVGDNPKNDIDPANAIGMKTVLNHRSGKYFGTKGKTEPQYIIQDMWELLEILRDNFGIRTY
jgi:putative hydrolase of the HAD superfamily